MTGQHVAATTQAAELQTLRQRTDERRRELGDTVAALVDKVAEETDARLLARQAFGSARRRAAGAGRAMYSRRPLLAPIAAAGLAAIAAAWWAARHREVVTAAVAALPFATRAAPRLQRPAGRRRRRRQRNEHYHQGWNRRCRERQQQAPRGSVTQRGLPGRACHPSAR